MLLDDLEPMEAEAATIEYADDAPISDEDAERICQDELCIEHGTGTRGCPVPETWGELREMQDKDYFAVPSDRVADDDGNVMVTETAEDVGLDEKQPVPDETTCPYCGANVDGEQVVKHRLSAMGYMHDDIEMECDECGSSWPHGVPVGEFEGEEAEDLFCSSCEQRFMRVHRVAPRWTAETEAQRKVILHLKCPNCYYFDKVQREAGPGGRCLIGYPDITGSTDGAEPEGYRD